MFLEQFRAAFINSTFSHHHHHCHHYEHPLLFPSHVVSAFVSFGPALWRIASTHIRCVRLVRPHNPHIHIQYTKTASVPRMADKTYIFRKFSSEYSIWWNNFSETIYAHINGRRHLLMCGREFEHLISQRTPNRCEVIWHMPACVCVSVCVCLCSCWFICGALPVGQAGKRCRCAPRSTK